MYKIAVLSSTGGTNFQSFIDAKIQNILDVEICCLITNKADCHAVTRAKEANIPSHFIDPTGKTREEFDAEVMKTINLYEVDLVVLGGYMRIISEDMVKEYEGRIINVHPSLLPKHGGEMNKKVHQSVLDAGETETGMTIHYVDKGLDTGSVISQQSIPVLPEDTADSLRARVQELEKEWYPRVVQMFSDGTINV